MLTSLNNVLILSGICCFILFLLYYSLNTKKQNNVIKAFSYICFLMVIWLFGLILQATLSKKLNIPPIYFDYFVYIGTCFMPVAFYNFSKIFSNTKYKLNKLLCIVPIISLLVLWTNNFHHLFYKKYSIYMSETVTGPYANVHIIYTYLLLIISFVSLIRYSIKNAGIFSKQAILFTIGSLIPIVINVLGTLGIIDLSIHATPICFAFTVLFYALAIFKFNFLTVAPIALQRIVDRISDSYVILNEDYGITDYNETFVKTFKVKNPSSLRGKHFAVFLKDIGLKEKIEEFGKYIEKIDKSKKIQNLELEVPKINKYFNIEITSIIVNNQFLGILVLFKDITQHIHDMESLKNNQDLLIEQERLASLGQMIGRNCSQLKNSNIFSCWRFRRFI